jgi:hypothetical protein
MALVGKRVVKARGRLHSTLEGPSRESDWQAYMQLRGGLVAQGACPQELAKAIEEARSPMRLAKLGRAKVRVMRSCK